MREKTTLEKENHWVEVKAHSPRRGIVSRRVRQDTLNGPQVMQGPDEGFTQMLKAKE